MAEEKMQKAVVEVIKETVSTFGIEFVKTLSWFYKGRNNDG